MRGSVLLLCRGGVRFQRVEDDANEEVFEAADRFASALAFGPFALEVGAGLAVGVAAQLPVEWRELRLAGVDHRERDVERLSRARQELELLE